MVEVELPLGILAEELVLGPRAGEVPLAARAADPRVAEERGRLAARLADIQLERHGLDPTLDADQERIESFRQLRDEILPAWSSPFLALDPDERSHAEGRALFGEVRTTLEQHYRFERPWHSAITALFVFQGLLARNFPAVFYLVIKGRFGGGKTSLLNLLSALGGGLVFENVSVPALVREMRPGRMICIDEFDVHRPQEVQAVMDAVVRQGYRKNAAPYVRYDAASRRNDSIPIYGPKALTVRKFLDPALEDRRFIISAGPADGPDGYQLVVRNLWTELGDLPGRLKRWADRAGELHPAEKLREAASSEVFEQRVRSVVHATGANRNTELAIVALETSDIIGVDLSAELREAASLKLASVGAQDAADLEDLSDVIVELTSRAPTLPTGREMPTRVWVREIKQRLDEARTSRGDRPISDGRLDTLLTELGVSASWKVRPRNKVGFDLPAGYLQRLREGGPNTPNRPNPTGVDGVVRTVRPVSPPTPDTGHCSLAEESWFTPTKGDRLRRTAPFVDGAAARQSGDEINIEAACSRYGLQPSSVFPGIAFHALPNDPSLVVLVSRTDGHQLGRPWRYLGPAADDGHGDVPC